MGTSKRRRAEIERLKRITTGLRNYRIYHGTVEPVAQRILSDETLRPRGGQASLYTENPSRRDCVYLTDLYGVVYGFRATINALPPEDSGVKFYRAAVVEMDYTKLDRGNLLADEDFMAAAAWATKNMNGCSKEEWKELVRHYATHDENASDLASESLLKHGTVAHRGPIPRSAITRIALVSAPMVSALRYRDYKDESLWEIIANPTPEDLTRTQRFQAMLTHQIFDERHPEVQVISL